MSEPGQEDHNRCVQGREEDEVISRYSFGKLSALKYRVLHKFGTKVLFFLQI